MLLPYKNHLNSKTIILGSGSPRRSDCLKNMGLNFRVIPSSFAENLDKLKFPTAREYVLETAKMKVLDVYDKLKAAKSHFDLLIGADSIVVVGENEIFEKPADKNHAFSMLSRLSASCHKVLTAVFLVFPNKEPNHTDVNAQPHLVSFVEETKVWFSNLREPAIKSYIETESPMDKAGAYGVIKIT